ncbi:MAG: 2'-deoxycytidine 5'-triphosphate deaminase, partial [Chloroflexi bacterium]|nr:2'-deoxycytidine 5'-triphosphate deaminase [Chloroflexota bacterium]
MVLSDRDIKDEIARGRIAIEPLDAACIQPASVDIHLGNRFRVFRNPRRPYSDVRQDMEDLTELVEVDSEPFMLHPG